MGRSPDRIGLEELLLSAIRDQNLRLVQTLIKSGELCLNKWLLDMGVTALHIAVGSGTEGFAACITHDMLRCGGDPNALSTDGMTPVHVAAAWGRTTVLHLLLLHGGDPWKLDEESNNAFSYAFERKAWQAVDLMHSTQFIISSEPQCCYHSPKIENSHHDIKSEEPEYLKELLTKSFNSSDIADQSPSSSPRGITDGNQIVQTPKASLFPSNVHNLTFSVETQTENVIEPQNIVKTYVSSQIISINSKEIKLGSDEKDCFKVPLPPPIPTKKITQKTPSPAKENRRLTYTISTPRSQKKETGYSRDDLFRELKEAVHRRASRISGVETLPDSTMGSVANESFASSCSDLNKAIISESLLDKLADNSSQPIDPSSNRAGSNRFIDEESALEYALLTETKFSDNLMTSDSSDSYLSLSDDSNSSITYESCNSPSSPVNGKMEDCDEIREKLLVLGVSPGPITPTTKAVYLRLLGRLQRQRPAAPPNTPASPVTTIKSPTAIETRPGVLFFPSSFSQQLEEAFKTEFPYKQGQILEEKLRATFAGVRRARTCFNYLLLDQRVTRNLQHRATSENIDPKEVLRQFAASVFYVGKGQASRPLEHLKEAQLAWQHRKEGKNPKEAKILDIWQHGMGVVCVRAFHDISKEEALSREAAMIEALRRQNLCNLQPGHFQGPTNHWTIEEKKKLGVYLLVVAKDIYLQTTQRAFRPGDI